MKEVVAIVRMNKMNQTKQSLADVGFSASSAVKVLGRGKGQVDYRLLRGAESGAEEAIAQFGLGADSDPQAAVTVVVPDKMVPARGETIIGCNQTGQAGDGKIFVLPVSDAPVFAPATQATPPLD